MNLKEILKEAKREWKEVNRGSRHVSILTETYSYKNHLRFKYDGQCVRAESEDYEFLDLLRRCIDAYVEEKYGEDKGGW